MLFFAVELILIFAHRVIGNMRKLLTNFIKMKCDIIEYIFAFYQLMKNILVHRLWTCLKLAALPV